MYEEPDHLFAKRWPESALDRLLRLTGLLVRHCFDGEVESCPFTQSRVCPDLSAMRLDDGPADR